MVTSSGFVTVTETR